MLHRRQLLFFDEIPNSIFQFEGCTFGPNADVIESTYAHILQKFKDDGRTNAAKILDIQHKQLTKSKLLNYLDRAWWNYGYNKLNELNWLIVLLTISLLINVLFWKQIGEAYPIIEFHIPQYRHHRRTHRLARIFLFTIFFSLRIDFGKLNYDRLGFVFVILIEYAIGEWCLFFIARTLLAF